MTPRPFQTGPCWSLKIALLQRPVHHHATNAVVNSSSDRHSFCFHSLTACCCPCCCQCTPTTPAGPRRQTLAHRELLQMPCHQAQTPPIKAAAATKPKVAPSAAAATATKPTQPQKAAATTQTPAASAGRTKPVALKASAAIRQLLQQDQGSIRQLLQAPAAPKVAPKPQRRPFATGRLPGLAPKQQRAPRRTQG